MKVDYSKGNIYKVTNDYNNDIYDGSTSDTLAERYSTHKKDAHMEKSKDRPLYKLINEIGFNGSKLKNFLIFFFPIFQFSRDLFRV